jgi:SAM-dependent methyltransferase
MGRTFDDMYAAGVPPWDIGRAQPVVVSIAEAGGFSGKVIDVGCGTGENALELAGRGLEVTGVDSSPLAIEAAKRKAQARGSSAEFLLADALALGELGRNWDSALDCGVFHVFEDPERELYVSSLASALRPGAVLHLMCFSERQPGPYGPRRVTQAELRGSFADGWEVSQIVAALFETLLPVGPAQAWLATILRAS